MDNARLLAVIAAVDFDVSGRGGEDDVALADAAAACAFLPRPELLTPVRKKTYSAAKHCARGQFGAPRPRF